MEGGLVNEKQSSVSIGLHFIRGVSALELKLLLDMSWVSTALFSDCLRLISNLWW